MEYFQSITINNSTYSGEKIRELVHRKLDENNIPDWEKNIYQFIGELINEKDYILANSSGTTGKAKQIKLFKRELVNSAIRTKKYFNLTSSDRALLCLPVSYIAGKMMIVRAFVIGFNLKYTEPSANPFENIKEVVDFSALTPHQLTSSIKNESLKKIRKIIVGGAPVSEALLQEIQRVECDIYETYGMTETCSHIAIKPLNGKNKSDFFDILPGFHVSVDNRQCLIVEAEDGTRLITNDIIQLESKRFKWLGRFDNVINSGGIKLFPEQIEKKLATALKQDLIIASEEHNDLGEQVILLLKKKNKTISKHDISELRNIMDGILSSYERPKKLYLLPEFIETSSGKIKRKETIASINRNRGYVL